MSDQFTGKIDIENFLKRAKPYLLLMYGPPSEFETGHIPGSLSIPQNIFASCCSMNWIGWIPWNQFGLRMKAVT